MIKETQDKGYNIIKKSHIERAQEIKELNETLDEVNKCYRELATTHEDLCERNRILQLHSIELDEARKRLEAKLQEINSLRKIDESPNDINSCEKTCVPKSEYEKLVIELEKLKIELRKSPNVLKGDKPCEKCKNKSSSDKEANVLIKLKDENEDIKLKVKSMKSGYGTLLKGNEKYNEMLTFHAINYERNGLGYPPFKDTCKPAPSIKLEKPKWCTECMTEGHFMFECNAPPKKPIDKQLRAFAFDAHYVLQRNSKGQVKARFMGKKDETRPKKLWVPKAIIPKIPNPNARWTPKPKPKTPTLRWVPKSQA